MIRRRRDAGNDIRQMQIDWHGNKSAVPIDPPAALPAATSERRPVLHLRWDFRTKFPEPLADAVDAGAISAEDTTPQGVAAIHEQHSRRMLEALSDLDAAMERQRTGMQPVRFHPDALTEPTRLQRWYASLLGLYEDWFGKEGAAAFDLAVQAWHASVEIIVDKDTDTRAVAAPPPALQPRALPMIDAVAVDSRPLVSEPPNRAVLARFPVPKPLAEAVAACHFGLDEDNRPIQPSSDEVRSITASHAEEIIDLIQSLPVGSRPRSPGIEAAIQVAVAKYAEDFGDPAARQLEAYCRRQARLRDTAAPRGR